MIETDTTPLCRDPGLRGHCHHLAPPQADAQAQPGGGMSPAPITGSSTTTVRGSRRHSATSSRGETRGTRLGIDIAQWLQDLRAPIPTAQTAAVGTRWAADTRRPPGGSAEDSWSNLPIPCPPGPEPPTAGHARDPGRRGGQGQPRQTVCMISRHASRRSTSLVQMATIPASSKITALIP
jgi:hypothetical protein